MGAALKLVDPLKAGPETRMADDLTRQLIALGEQQLEISKDTNSRVRDLESKSGAQAVDIGRLQERQDALKAGLDSNWKALRELQGSFEATAKTLAANISDGGTRVVKLEENAITPAKLYISLGALGTVVLAAVGLFELFKGH